MMRTMKRTISILLAMMLMLAVMLPVAAVAEEKAEPKASTPMTTYVGLKTNLTVFDRYGNAFEPTDYKWSTSDKKVVTVSGSGVMTAKKTGKAKITAVSKTNKKDKSVVTVTVKKNKVDNINSKPSVSSIPYKNFDLVMKSVEFESPKKVVVEYYLIFNAPSSWRTVKLTSVTDTISVWDENTYQYITLAEGTVKNTKISMKGGQVKTVKVTFDGSKVKETNMKLSDVKYNISNDIYMDARLQYKRPR